MNYIISSGDESAADTGLTFYHSNGTYTFSISKPLKKWEVSFERVPESWFHVAFTWNIDRLNYYENGVLKAAAGGTQQQNKGLIDKFSLLLLGNASSADQRTFSENLQVFDLTTWYNTIAEEQIKDHMTTRKLNCLGILYSRWEYYLGDGDGDNYL